MTFLTTRYRLTKALASADYPPLSHLSTVYGIRGLSFEESYLVVEYDASRIHEAEVLAEVRRAGLAVEPEKPIAPGGFDRTGEFRDFAWPTQGLTPVNAKQP
jgi:hypothetical protein